MKIVDRYHLIGAAFIITGVMLNEWMLKDVLRIGAAFNTPVKSYVLIAGELLLIATGVYVLRKRRAALWRLSAVVLSTIAALAVMEFILSFDAFGELDAERPIWIPAEYRSISQSLKQQHALSAARNEFGFNDVNHPREYPDTIDLRIAVLGDSFLWGVGVPDSVIWTRKLEKLFREDGIRCEVFNWGKSGWSTADEFHFLREHGAQFQFDLLVFAYVVNDPVLDSSTHFNFITIGGAFDRIVLRTVAVIFPNVVAFTTDAMNNIASRYFGMGYVPWLDGIYSPGNLSAYSQLIHDIRTYCEDRGMPVLFVLTPENHNMMLKQHFDKVIPIFRKENIPHVDLYPAVQQELGHRTNRSLWGNPGDGHPGGLVTDVYANHVHDHIRQSLMNKNSKGNTLPVR